MPGVGGVDPNSSGGPPAKTDKIPFPSPSFAKSEMMGIEFNELILIFWKTYSVTRKTSRIGKCRGVKYTMTTLECLY